MKASVNHSLTCGVPQRNFIVPFNKRATRAEINNVCTKGEDFSNISNNVF